jgi:hypothetical protein
MRHAARQVRVVSYPACRATRSIGLEGLRLPSRRSDRLTHPANAFNELRFARRSFVAGKAVSSTFLVALVVIVSAIALVGESPSIQPMAPGLPPPPCSRRCRCSAGPAARCPTSGRRRLRAQAILDHAEPGCGCSDSAGRCAWSACPADRSRSPCRDAARRGGRRPRTSRSPSCSPPRGGQHVGDDVVGGMVRAFCGAMDVLR